MPDENTYRWSLLVIMLVGLAMSAYFRRKADRVGGRVARRGDGPVIRVLLALSGLTGVGSLVVYLVNPAWMAWSRLDLPDPVRLTGAGLGVVALGLFWWVFCHLGTNVTPTAQTRANHVLVTSGPYRWVRHPMYASGVVLFAAYALLTANWFVALMCGLTFTVLLLRTSVEEANLIGRFGDDYREYVRRTGRFLPRLPRSTPTQNGS